MKWNPFLSAVAASAYIGAVVLFLHFITSIRHDTPDTYLDGLGFISLFVCSAAVMAFLFFYQPVLMIVERRTKEAVSYFLTTLAIFGVITIAVLVFVSMQKPNATSGAADYMHATYMIEGQPVTLGGNTKYFGNELQTDLDGDGRQDTAFIVTQNNGGSGTFFYAVAALNTKDGYIGSDGYLLGDRIAPQNTTLSQNPKQVGVVVFNYADRAPTEPMSTKPSIGKSVYLKLDRETMRWGIAMPNFEGESR